MLEKIKINALISPLEANYITSSNKFKKAKTTPTGIKTTELYSEGIIEINIWFNLRRMMSESLTDRYCTINATIDVTKMQENGLDDLLGKITERLPEKPNEAIGYRGAKSLEWKINSAIFVFTFEGYLTETYYKLFRGGYELKKQRLKRTISKEKDKDNNIVCKTEYTSELSRKTESIHDPLHISITLTQQEEKEDNTNQETKKQEENNEQKTNIPITYVLDTERLNRLQIKIHLRKRKIGEICREHDIANYNLKKFLEKIYVIEEEVLRKYVSLITGKWDFYKYKDAEKKIMDSEFSKKEKEKMCDVLRAIASYKGIANYLNHVEDEKIAYESMASVRRKPYAQKVLRNLEACKINPLTISIRTEIPSDKLDNLVTVYKRGISKVIGELPQEQPKKEEIPPAKNGKGFMDIEEDETDDIPFW